MTNTTRTALALLVSTLVGGCSTGESETMTPTAEPLYYPVTVDHTGGCVMMGPNCVRYVIQLDGTVEVYRRGRAEPELVGATTVDGALIAELSTAMVEVDFAALRSRLGPGHCEGCRDGIDITITFTVDGAEVAFDSLEEELDPAEPIFSAIGDVVAAADGAVEVPLEAWGR
jgi:hypothetical protein